MFSDPYRKAYSQMAFASGDDAYVEAPARRDALAVLRFRYLDGFGWMWESIRECSFP